MSQPSGSGALRPAGLALSLLLIGVAGGLVYAGWQMFVFSQLQATATTLLRGQYAEQPEYRYFPAIRAAIGQWRETPGARNAARALYATYTRALSAPAPESLAATIDVLKIDPVSADAWADFALAGLASSRPDLAVAGWDMSSLTAPREHYDQRWRLHFLPAVWDAASPEQKQRYFFELDFAEHANVIASYRTTWSQIARTLSPERRRQIEAEYQAYLHPAP